MDMKQGELGRAIAPIHWHTISSEPVIAPGQLNGEFDARAAAGGHVIRIGDTYRMYYWGIGADGVNRTCMAEAPVTRPDEWRGLGAVLGPQENTDYNCGGPVCVMVLPQDDGPWLLYAGTCGRSGPKGRPQWYSALATSDDEGMTWQYRTTEPLIPPTSSYDCSGTGTLWVLRRDAIAAGSRGGQEPEPSPQYHMYYTAVAAYEKRPEACRSEQHSHSEIPIVGIGYAVSNDGIHWEKPCDDFLISPRRDGVDPYENWVARPMVLREPEGLRMWLSNTGVRYRIFSAISLDGLTWAYLPSDPARGDLGVGMPGAFDDLQRSYASVVKEGDAYRMWYTGNGHGRTGMGVAVGCRT